MKEADKPQQASLQEQRGGNKSPERQPLPNVWDVLERNVRLHAPDVEDRQRSRSQGFWREVREVDRLERRLEENGTARDKLILDLFNDISLASPYTWPGHRTVSLEEFQQFRSRIEPMQEEQIREEIHKAEDEWSRKYDPFYKRG